ncbi:hypothetical protein [Oricola sp.]|uniref:hypothetical protein n=1 Tax=Oricola sp. TaxID=1979950 RepID=UPI003BA94CE4
MSDSPGPFPRRIPRLTAAVLAAGLASPVLAANAADSVYTDLDLDACTVVSSDEESGGVDLLCAGYGNWPVFVAEGDLRMDVDFGVKNQAFQTFGPFNYVHKVVEWRVENGVPFAAILRFFVETGMNGNQQKGQVLLVSKVGQPGAPGCPVAAVDTKTVEQANGVARGLAALAPLFNCAVDNPVAVGAPDSFAFSFYGAVAEGSSQ